MFAVFVVMVELSITSENVTKMVVLSFATEVAESTGEVEETVGAVVSSLKAYDSKAGMVADIPRLL